MSAIYEFFINFSFLKLIFLPISFLLFSIGLLMFITRLMAFRNGRAIPVKLTIIAHRKKDNNEEKKAARSLYEIASGPYKKRQKISRLGTHPPIHDVGEVVDGLYNIEKNEIESLKTLQKMKKIEWGFYIVSIIIFLFVLIFSSM